MKHFSFVLTYIFIFPLLVSCSLPYTISINIAPSTPTNTPTLLSSSPTLRPTETKVPTKTKEPTPNVQLTATAEAKITQSALDECMKEVPIQGDSTYKNIVCENFENNAYKWPEGTDEDAKFGTIARSIKNGQYIWDVNSKSGVFRWECMAEMPDVDSFEASVQVRKLRGPTSDACYGLVFRAQEVSDEEWNYYTYLVCDSNNFLAARQSNNAWTTISYLESAGAVKPGGPNWLTVVANGSQFDFYVNGHKAGTANDAKIKSGQVCIGMQIPGHLNAGFAFHKFVVRGP